MAVELEAKVKVAEHASYQQRLRDAGAALLGDFAEVNMFFDKPDGSLIAGDRGLRLRLNRHVATGVVNAIVTYKGPRQPGPLKVREEIETAVSDADSFIKILLATGFKLVMTFEKKRQSWKLGECKVELDELPYLGLFLEVEGPSEDSITHVLGQIGVDGPMVREGYAGLLRRWLAERGEIENVVVFDG